MKSIIRRVIETNTSDKSIGWRLLWLRVMAGAFMIYGHGWGKFSGFSTRYETFGDPLGIGSPLSMTLAVFAEFFCSILLMIGLATRAVAIPLLITMLVAALIVHADDPWGRKELALVYAVPFVALIVTGGGRYSVDGWWLRRRKGAD